MDSREGVPLASPCFRSSSDGRPHRPLQETRRLGRQRPHPLLGHPSARRRLRMAGRADECWRMAGSSIGSKASRPQASSSTTPGAIRPAICIGTATAGMPTTASGTMQPPRAAAQVTTGKADRLRRPARPRQAAGQGEEPRAARLPRGDHLLPAHHPLLRRRSVQQLLLPRPHQVQRRRARPRIRTGAAISRA